MLHLHRSMHRLEVYCDSSFGLEHEGGRSVQGTLIEWAGSPIQWSSSRQPLVAASTGEAELLGYSEGHQQGLSIGAILNTLEIKPTYVLYGECKSALSLASTDSGPWRTRHLRLRAHKLREALRLHSPDPTQEPEWSARHLSGIDLVADGMTKPLLGASFLRFAKRLSLHGSWLNNLEDGATCLKKCNPSNPPFVDDADEGVGRQLVALGSLLIRGFSAVVAKCGHLLIAAGAIMIDRFENENLDVQRGETNNHDGPRLCAFRAQGPHDQAPVRPSRRPVEPQASRRGYAACPMEHSETPSQSMQSDQEFEGTSMGIMLLYNILLVRRIAGWSLKTAGWCVFMEKHVEGVSNRFIGLVRSKQSRLVVVVALCCILCLILHMPIANAGMTLGLQWIFGQRIFFGRATPFSSSRTTWQKRRLILNKNRLEHHLCQVRSNQCMWRVAFWKHPMVLLVWLKHHL